MSIRTHIKHLVQRSKQIRQGHTEYFRQYIDNKTERGDFGEDVNHIPSGYESGGAATLDYFIDRGLQRHHSVLDLGCGDGRIAPPIVDYLDSDEGRYIGMDISDEALNKARERLSDYPNTELIQNTDLTFQNIEANTIDQGVAISVVTHLPSQHVEELFENLHRVLAPDGEFTITFYHKQSEGGLLAGRLNPRNYQYSNEFFINLAKRHGYEIHFNPGFPHDRHDVFRLTPSQ